MRHPRTISSATAIADLRVLTLNVDGAAQAFSNAEAVRPSEPNVTWSFDPATDWIDGTTVSVSLTTPPVPAKPAGLKAVAGDAQVALSWTDPGDASITRYQYQQKAGSAAWGSWTDIPDSAPGQANAASYTVASLRNGTAYRFRIRAVNIDGNGAQSDVAGPVTAGATVVWTATLTVDKPDEKGGCDSRLASYDDCSSPSVLTDDNFVHGGTTYTVNELTFNEGSNLLLLEFVGGTGSSLKRAFASLALTVDGTALHVGDALGFNDRGNGQLSWYYNPQWTDGQSVSLSLAEAAPAKLDGLTATAGNAQVTLSWYYAVPDASITKYQYQQRTGSGVWATTWTDIPDSAPGEANAASYTVAGLRNATEHRFRVRAVNSLGGGPQSDVAGPVTPVDPRATVWSATLTADRRGDDIGCSNAGNLDDCSSNLADDDFVHGGATYTVDDLVWNSLNNKLTLKLNIGGQAAKAALSSLTLIVDGAAALTMAAAEIRGDNDEFLRWSYNPDPDWDDGKKVKVSLTGPSTTGQPTRQPPPSTPVTPGQPAPADTTPPRRTGGGAPPQQPQAPQQPAETEDTVPEECKETQFDCEEARGIKEGECDALVALYDATCGAGWNWAGLHPQKTPWFTTPFAERWQGVTLEEMSVRELSLDGRNLRGELPQELADLESLEVLDLSSNQGLTGDLPREQPEELLSVDIRDTGISRPEWADRIDDFRPGPRIIRTVTTSEGGCAVASGKGGESAGALLGLLLVAFVLLAVRPGRARMF